MARHEPALLMRMYRDVALTKAFNGRFVTLKREGRVPGPIHQTEGQEAVGVGVCSALNPEDYVVNYYRGFAEWVTRGVDLAKLSAELLGKESGLCHGKGGEMSLADPSVGIVSCSGIIGGSIPTGVGVAFGALSSGESKVTAVFFGDGAVNTGAFHEGLNMAGFLRVPAVFVCLNNQYAISTYVGDVTAGGSIVKRAGAYGMPGVQVDGNDVLDVYDAATTAVARARAGKGPSLIEALTYRIGGHSSTNPEVDFMDSRKFDEYRAREPGGLLRDHILAAGVASVAALDRIDSEAEHEAQAAIDFGLEADWPDPEIATQGMFV